MFPSLLVAIPILLLGTMMASLKANFLMRWRRPLPQVLLIGLVCFCCPGMYNAIQGIGGGGGAASNQSLVSKANAAVYVLFSVVALFGGALINKFGPRICLSVGCFSYGLYIGSLWPLARTGNEGFVIFSGCMLGIGAAFLWATQGAVTMSYPPESERARAFSYQLIIYTLGSSIGGLVALADSVSNNELSSVNNGTYIAFIAIVVIGSVLALALANPAQVCRKDGSPVSIEVSADCAGEIRALGRLLKKKSVWLMMPAFIASNWYYAYLFSMNSYYFSLRGRSLNAALFWAVEPLGTLFMSSILDMKKVERRKRGLLGLAAITVCVCAIWTGGAIFQSGFDRDQPSPKLDWNVDLARWGRAFALYISYGFSDAMFSTYCTWIIGTRSNDPRILAHYSGIYRSVQSAGAALSFVVDAVRTRFLIQFIINFVLVAGSLPFLAMVAWSIKSTNYGMEAGDATPTGWDDTEKTEKGANDIAPAISKVDELAA